ncbi:MAG TPA: substrate-binding domain-containing protein [Acidimicrobiales bacterium]
MQVQTTRRLAWLALPLSLVLVAGACGSDDDDAGTDGAGSAEDFSGQTVSVTGSSTVAPISEIVGEDFGATTGAEVTVDDPGTGDGFVTFCEGGADIADASRPIDEEEVAACEENGVEYVELKIAFDGMAVMTNADNDDVECLSFADLYALIGPESQGVERWSDAQAIATELGSDTTFPDAELSLTGPGVESGTYDSFVEIALGDIAEERGQEETTRTDYEASAEDNTILANIEASDTSLGWVGFAYADQGGDAIKILEVAAEPGGECVAPDAGTIADGSYPLARPLYIYVNTAKAEENPAVAGYVDFYLSDLAGFVEAADYVALPDDQAEATQVAWDER